MGLEEDVKKRREELLKKTIDMQKSMDDMGVAILYAEHIMNPCSVKVGSETFGTREFYLREANRVLPTLESNLYAKKFLQDIIDKYEKHTN